MRDPLLIDDPLLVFGQLHAKPGHGVPPCATSKSGRPPCSLHESNRILDPWERLSQPRAEYNPDLTPRIRRKSLRDVSDFADARGIFRLYTSDICKPAPLAVVPSPRSERSPSSTIPHRDVRRTRAERPLASAGPGRVPGRGRRSLL